MFPTLSLALYKDKGLYEEQLKPQFILKLFSLEFD